MFDLVIAQGEVIDGQRRPRFRADVGVVGDRIAAVGDLRNAQRRRTIDASGRIVAPGFIDVHNHSDGWLLKLSHFTAKTRQGFTTEVLASDGISYAPVNGSTRRQWLYYLHSLNGLEMHDDRGWCSLADYGQQLHHSSAQNAVMQIPYANIRSLVCGFGCRAVDDFQMRQIQYEIRLAMEQGGVGLSTGIDYIVQCFSSTTEIALACEAIAEQGGVYVSHVRYKQGLMKALAEAVEIGRRAGVPVHISHLKAQPSAPAEMIFEFLEQAGRELDITFDVYPYQPGSTMLSYLLPYEVWEDGPLSALGHLERAEMRSRFRDGLSAYRLDLDHIRIAWLPSRENACHIGQTLAEFVRERGTSAEDALLNLLVSEAMAVLCVMDEGDDRLVHPFLAHPRCMIGTDGIFFPDSCVHPRVYGSSGRILGPAVRDWKLFSLEDAVYKLSGFAAARFRLPARGVIAEQAFADLVVFNPETVTDYATFAEPHQFTVGIEQVLVNGVPVIQDSKPIMQWPEGPPGRFLTPGN